MSSKSTISISFKVEDGVNGLKTLAIDAEGLAKALRSNVTEADRVRTKLANLSSISVGIGQLQGVIQNFQSVLKGLTDDYAVQIQAETQLENSMRNTMSATDAEIQSIKDLCSAQQQLGVIGDEVQLAGAQKLATFLSEKNSLAALIPVMNDVVAKQNGFNATGENAATVATAIGKAMSGQTAALGKMGISFSDAQKSANTLIQRSHVLIVCINRQPMRQNHGKNVSKPLKNFKASILIISETCLLKTGSGKSCLSQRSYGSCFCILDGGNRPFYFVWCFEKCFFLCFVKNKNPLKL